MNRSTEPFASCDWCGRAIRYGNACLTVSRQIEQVEWDEELEDGAITVIDAEALLVLCARCGNRLDAERLRAALRRPPGASPARDPAGSEAREETDEEETDEEETGWEGDPRENAAYSRFVRALLAHAGEAWQARAADGRRVPPITSGLIDYTGEYEGTPVHLGRGEDAGWVDPSLTEVGSCSREVTDPETLQEEPFLVTRRERALSLITVARPTWIPPDDEGSFYERVVSPLLDLPPEQDHLYGWLEVMFRFCLEQRFAWFARYAPGPRVHALAREWSVEVVHFALDELPAELREEVERHRTFRFLNLTRGQWEALYGESGGEAE